MERCGIVVHDTGCGDLWARRLEGSGLDLLGIHPAGGPDAHLSLVSCMETVRTPAFRAFRGQVRHLPELLSLFGTEDATALDYWTDNSFFSRWTRPPARFARDAAVCRADAAAYARAGFEAVTCFACFLGEDYEARWGAPPLDGFLAALRAARRP